MANKLAVLAALGAAAAQVAVTVSDKAREFAGAILQAGLFLEEFKADMFGLVREAFAAGCTPDELEAAEPDLKKLQSYRSAKSALVNAKAEGISLFAADGSPKGRTALEKETAAKREAAKGADANAVTPSTKGANGAKYAYTDKHAVVVAAFAFLKAEPTMRKAYRVEIMETARALANDEATTVKARKPQSVRRAVGAQSAPVAPVAPMSTAAQRDKARTVDTKAAQKAHGTVADKLAAALAAQEVQQKAA